MFSPQKEVWATFWAVEKLPATKCSLSAAAKEIQSWETTDLREYIASMYCVTPLPLPARDEEMMPVHKFEILETAKWPIILHWEHGLFIGGPRTGQLFAASTSELEGGGGRRRR
jgi:hypothetical protein